jgi:hypothetical protein
MDFELETLFLYSLFEFASLASPEKGHPLKLYSDHPFLFSERTQGNLQTRPPFSKRQINMDLEDFFAQKHLKIGNNRICL